MKKLYITMIAMIFASFNCMADDVVTFEDIAVNADGYQNDFGEESAFEAGGFTFNNNYFPEWSYWSGIAVSGRTATTFTSYELDQFNSCVGEGVNGSKQFAVVYPQGETIDVNDPAGKQISGFYVTNNRQAEGATEETLPLLQYFYSRSTLHKGFTLWLKSRKA